MLVDNSVVKNQQDTPPLHLRPDITFDLNSPDFSYLYLGAKLFKFSEELAKDLF